MEGKRILITGGSAGLGAAIASKLASLGAVCAINYASNESQATDLIRKLQNDRSNDAAAKHVLIKGSVFAESTAKAVVQEAIEVLGGLDGVVSNAGWTKFADFRDLDSMSTEDWGQCYAANTQSHLWIMQAAKAELQRNEGSFLITASVAGVMPSGSSMAYGRANSNRPR